MILTLSWRILTKKPINKNKMTKRKIQVVSPPNRQYLKMQKIKEKTSQKTAKRKIPLWSKNIFLMIKKILNL